MDTKHTPTPWRRVENIVCGPSDGYTDNIAACAHRIDADQITNAAFIARACNAHDDLVAALVRLLRATEADVEQCPEMDVLTAFETNSQAIQQARAALAKARGE